MIQYFQSLLFEAREESGQTMAEYAVVLAVITLIVVAASSRSERQITSS